MGNWSTPQEVIYPLNPPNNATAPFMATDGSGNTLAVWFDTTGSGSMQAAALAAGAVNGEGQPLWVVTSPVASSNVQAPTDPNAQAVGVDGEGNATAVWTDGDLVYVATLAAGQSTWSSPTTINTPIALQSVANLYIAVAANGNAIVSWVSSVNPYDTTLLANVFDVGSQTWLGQTNLNPGGTEYDLTPNPVAVDPQGNGVIAFRTTNNNIQAASYNSDSATWTQIPSLATDDIAVTAVAMNSSGNATIVWIQLDNVIYGSTLLFNAPSLTNLTLLSPNSDSDTPSSKVVVDSAGNAVAVWPDTSGALASARYSSEDATWMRLSLLDLSGTVPENIAVAGDLNGNAIASWTIPSETSAIQTAALPLGQTSWILLTTLSTEDANKNSHSVLTTGGNGVVLWENDVNGGVTGTIDATNFLNMFGALPVSYFTGKVMQSVFLNKTNRIHHLFWGASSDDAVLQYKLYRSGQLLTTVAAGAADFSYQDHDRSKNESDTYMLVAVNSESGISVPLFVTLQ